MNKKGDNMFKNPIIKGFYPDPSIIRVEDDFYIVNSSFEYFPAIPIWHTRDFKHMKQIGHAISRQDQGLDLSDVNPSGGVQAATIRYHKGIYYIVSTVITSKWPAYDKHFIVYAKDPKGPWSKVHYIQNAEGIDASLFFDDDGTCYFLANRQIPGQEDGNKTEIWMSKFNIETFQLEGEKYPLWQGTGGVFPEGPHLYKKDGIYYLLIAEGGTLHHHAVTVAFSKDVFGPYQSSRRNPILTHRHLNRTYPIQNVGHADLVELKDGSWVGVCLGSRPRGGFYDGYNIKYSFGGYYRNLGRETFVFPVSWPSDGEGPVISGETGKIEFEYDMNFESFPQTDQKIDLTPEGINTKWATIKERKENHIKVLDNKMTIFLQHTLQTSFIGFRQTSWKSATTFQLDTSRLKKEDTFCFCSWINVNAFIGIKLTNKSIDWICRHHHKETIIKSMIIQSKVLEVSLHTNDQSYQFSVNRYHVILDGRHISPDLNDSHTGVTIGFSGTSEDKDSFVIIKRFKHEVYEK